MSEVYLNGRFMPAAQATISPLDRGFLFADGVYEVIPVFNGVMFGADGHLRRLDRSLAALEIASPMSREDWEALCGDLIARNGGGDQALYMQVTRGAPGKRDHGFPSAEVPPTIFMTSSPLSLSGIHAPDSATGGSAILADDIRWGRCDIKSVALLPNVLARQKAVEAGAIEAILLRDGLLTEGSSTNVFVVKDGRVATPALSNRILGGITRDLTVSLCREHGLPLDERDVTEAELRAADEIWITSSTKDVMPVVRLEGETIGEGRPGPMWHRIAGHFLAHKRDVCGF